MTPWEKQAYDWFHFKENYETAFGGKKMDEVGGFKVGPIIPITENNSSDKVMLNISNSTKWFDTNNGNLYTVAKYVTEKELDERIKGLCDTLVQSHNVLNEKCSKIEAHSKCLERTIEVLTSYIEVCQKDIQRLEIKLNPVVIRTGVIGLTECNRCKTKFVNLEQKAEHYKFCKKKWFHRLFFWCRRK